MDLCLAAEEGPIKVRHFDADDDVVAVLAFFDAHFAGAESCSPRW